MISPAHGNEPSFDPGSARNDRGCVRLTPPLPGKADRQNSLRKVGVSTTEAVENVGCGEQHALPCQAPPPPPPAPLRSRPACGCDVSDSRGGGRSCFVPVVHLRRPVRLLVLCIAIAPASISAWTRVSSLLLHHPTPLLRPSPLAPVGLTLGYHTRRRRGIVMTLAVFHSSSVTGDRPTSSASFCLTNA